MTPIEDDSIEGLDADETKLFEVRRHWFGLVIVYIEVGVGFAAVILLLIFLGPIIFSQTDPSQRNLYISILVGAGAIVTWLILILFTYIYRQNKIIISDKNLTQIYQRGLFSRQVSELSMANVEDVTANKHGFFATLLDFGDMQVETAGERENFDFILCPRPNYYGKIVLQAREKFLRDPNNPRN